MHIEWKDPEARAKYDALIREHLTCMPSKLELHYRTWYPVLKVLSVALVEGTERTVTVRWACPDPLVIAWQLPDEAAAARRMVDLEEDFDLRELSVPEEELQYSTLRNIDDLWDQRDSGPTFIGSVDESSGQVLRVTSESGDTLTGWDDIWPEHGTHFSQTLVSRTARVLHFEDREPVVYKVGQPDQRPISGPVSSMYNSRYFDSILAALV
jgi:hypothetical protein